MADSIGSMRTIDIGKWLLTAMGAGLLVLFALPLFSDIGSGRQTLAERGRLTAELDRCRGQSLQRIGGERPSIDLLGTIARHCYEQARGEGLLGELAIRRTAFAEQAYQGRVILWMVVLITISGVALACIQLLMAFRLASMGLASDNAQSEVTIERGKIAVKSSITGLLILAVSFAFFLVYVLWIYTIEEANMLERQGVPVVENSIEEVGAIEPDSGPLENQQEIPR